MKINKLVEHDKAEKVTQVFLEVLPLESFYDCDFYDFVPSCLKNEDIASVLWRTTLILSFMRLEM